MPVPAHYHPAVQLHRIRFLDHTPSPITALAFAPIPLPSPSLPKSLKGKERLQQQPSGKEELGSLVLARENGDVEVWTWARDDAGGVGNWVLHKVLPPTLTHPTISHMTLVIRDPLAFQAGTRQIPKIQELRLFTAGSDDTEIAERCLLTGRILNVTPVPSAPLWSLSVSPTHTLLCLSTTAPTLTFLSIPSVPGPLEPAPPHLLRCESVPSRTRTVSIAWGPPKVVDIDGTNTWVDSYLVTGNSDSSFRKWNLPSPTESGRIGVRVTIKGRVVVEKVHKKGRGLQKSTGSQKGTIVWGVGVLPDHTIVTSDSLGSVTFWDGASLAQKQSFQAHKADGMCLAIGPGGRTVFTSGPDQRVCQFTSVAEPSGERSWVLSGAKRIHSHDVRCIAVFPPYTPNASPVNPGIAPVIASGGWDMSLSISPAAASNLLVNNLRNPLAKPTGMSRAVFDEGFSRKLSYCGGGKGTGRISVSRNGRLIVCRKDRQVGIWRVLDEDQGWEKLVEMDLRLRTHLISSTVSNNGEWLAISDLYETKLFRLVESASGSITPVRVKAFLDVLFSSEQLADLALQLGTGSSSLLFTPDSQRLIVGFTNLSLAVVELPLEEGDEPRVMKSFLPLESDGGRTVVKRNRVKKAQTFAAAAAATAAEQINGDGDVDMTPQDDNASVPKSFDAQTLDAWIACMAASDDGQWLAVSDLAGRVAIYNLDTLRLHVHLPTFTQAPSALAFPPAHPSLLCIATATGSLQFYHIEHRRLLPPTNQLATLNAALRLQFTPLQSISFEPSRYNSRSSRIVVWAHDWVCSAQLDLEIIGRLAGKKGNALLKGYDGEPGSGETVSKTLRRKRAREAREALELVSLSGSSDVPSTPLSSLSTGASNGNSTKSLSSAADPEFFKITTDKFRAVAGVDWFGEGEMVVVERPYGDFVGELPQAFWAGSFGRS